MPHIGPEKNRSDPEANRFDWFPAAFFLKLGGEGKRNGYQIKNLDLFRVIFFLLAVTASISSACGLEAAFSVSRRGVTCIASLGRAHMWYSAART